MAKNNNMEDYVTYEQAIKLKEIGFDWECNYIYKKDFFNQWIFFHCLRDAYRNHNQGGESEPIFVSAPTLSQAQKWLREVKGICVELRIHPLYRNWFGKVFDLKDYPNINFVSDIDLWDTYEQALSVGISKALEILK